MIKHRLYIEYLIIFVLFLLSNVVSSSFGYIAIFFVIVFVIVGDSTDTLGWILFLLPNIRILDVIGFIFGINILVVIASLKILFIETNDNGNKFLNLYFHKYHIIGMFMVLMMEFFHVVLDPSERVGYLFNGVNIAFNLLVGFKILNWKLRLQDYRKLSYSLIIGVYNSVLVFILTDTSVLRHIVVSGYRLDAYGNDPNYLSVYVIMGMTSILIFSYYSKLGIKEIIMLLLLVVIELLTLSKMGIICMFIVIALYIIVFVVQGHLLKIGGILARVVPIIVITFYFFGNMIFGLWDKFLYRFSGSFDLNQVSHLTSGRNYILEFYVTHYFDNLVSFLFGRGVNYLSYYKQFGVVYVAHNTYFDFILSWGLIGCIIFLVICYAGLRESISLRFHNFIDFLPSIMLLIMFLSLSCMSSDMFWYITPFAMIPLSKLFIKNSDLPLG